MNQDQDDLVIQLLERLDRYEKLANDSFRVNFITGMQHLSRANFNSENRKYGMDSLDRRPYDACKVVEGNGSFKLRDRLRELKEKNKLEKEKESLDPEKETTLEGQALRQRKKDSAQGEKSEPKSKKEGVLEKSVDPPSLRDPVYQFGVLVPYQLRNAQSSFNDSLTDIVNMVNLRRELTELIQKIESTDAEAQIETTDASAST